MDLGLSVEHGAARLVGEGAVTLGSTRGPGRVLAGPLSGERRAAEKDRGMAAFTAALWAQQATPKCVGSSLGPGRPRRACFPENPIRGQHKVGGSTNRRQVARTPGQAPHARRAGSNLQGSGLAVSETVLPHRAYESR